MELVVDTNIIISAMLTTGKTQELLFNKSLRFYAPDYLLAELSKYRELIKEKTGFDDREFEKALSLVTQKINVIAFEEYDKYRKTAFEAVSDKKDWPFIALALSTKCSLWSNDKKLAEQKIVPVLNTKELIELIES